MKRDILKDGTIVYWFSRPDGGPTAIGNRGHMSWWAVDGAKYRAIYAILPDGTVTIDRTQPKRILREKLDSDIPKV